MLLFTLLVSVAFYNRIENYATRSTKCALNVAMYASLRNYKVSIVAQIHQF